MTDAMFTFAGHALASGQATGQFPGMGGARLVGRLAALSALSDARRQARRLRGAGAEILAGVHRRDRACAGVRRRPPRSGGDQGRGRRHHRRQERRRMAAGVRRRRLLRHHHGDAGGGAARSAFRRARPVRPHGRRAVGRDHAGAAGADRSGVSRRPGTVKAVPKLGGDSRDDQRWMNARCTPSASIPRRTRTETPPACMNLRTYCPRNIPTKVTAIAIK